MKKTSNRRGPDYLISRPCSRKIGAEAAVGITRAVFLANYRRVVGRSGLTGDIVCQKCMPMSGDHGFYFPIIGKICYIFSTLPKIKTIKEKIR